jgi:heme-degrading monooxygenase HmoA
MPKFQDLDRNVTMMQQVQDRSRDPVILMNVFTVDPPDVDAFLTAWTADAEIMKRQPGFISTQLHRGIAGSCVFVNYAVWETPEHFGRAFANPEFQSKLKDYPASAIAAPHLLRKLAVPGICVG